MSTLPPGSDLGGKSYLTVVVRLLVDEHGALVHGEVLDLQGASRQRFVDWEGMVRAVRACLPDGTRGAA
ncbi:MAG TPA: hypothetical protein VFJ24_09270 [Gaiellales bacterium]|nr:hypothetical protein [Gaiellales bacterium]